MRKALVIVMLALCAAAVVPVAFGEDGDTDKKFSVTGDVRMRWERLENYFDFQDSKDSLPGSDDAFSFFPYRIRVGVSGELADNVQVVLDLQNFGSWGNQHPNQSFFFPPFQNFDGDGNSNGFRSSETSIYQGILKLNDVGGSGVNVSLGRQEGEFGTGLILGNEDYYNGTVFDGAHAVWTRDNWQIAGMYYMTSERNDLANNTFNGFTADDQTLWGFVGSWHLGEARKSHVDGYLINFNERVEDFGRPEFWTLGGHWWRTADTKADVDESPLDWNIEIALQTGGGTDPTNGEDFDLGGNILEGSVVWNFASENHHQRVHLGVIRESGDDDITDDDFDGWNRLFPRLHGRYGDVDFMSSIGFGPFSGVPSGIWAPSIGYSTSCQEGRHEFGIDLFWFKPVEDKIRISDSEPDFKVRNFGKEADLRYSYKYSQHVTLSAGIGYFKPTRHFGELLGFADPVTEEGFDDPVTRITGGARVRF